MILRIAIQLRAASVTRQSAVDAFNMSLAPPLSAEQPLVRTETP